MIMPAPITVSRVLLVEDEEQHAELARRAFERTPELELTVVSSMAGARAALAQALPDLIIADLQLPDGQGIELVPADPAHAAYPVLIATSHGDESVAVEMMKAGALDYVVKTGETLADLPRFAARALREWNLVLERRRTEAELVESTRRERHGQRLESIGRLASGVAHDFNNLLMVMSGCADVALDHLGPNDKARPFIEELRNAALGGASITRSLLTFGRRTTLEPVVVEVDRALGSTRELLRSALGAKLKLELRQQAAGACITCGVGEIEQVVLNLALNSRDAMEPGGRLTVATRVVTLDRVGVSGLEPGEYVVVTVADTGAGMDAQTLSRAFEPFFTTKEPGKGTGLGLSMVYGMVKGWGGQVTVESLPGEGTTFEIHVPRTRARPTELSLLPADQRLAALVKPLTVLVIEDDPRVRMLARHYLSLDGHRVLEAHDAQTARQAWAEAGRAVGLLLTDVALPGNSGPQIAAELRSAQPQLPVLFMSAHASLSLSNEQQLPPGAKLLAKPFTHEDLSARVAELVGSPKEPDQPESD